MPRPIRHDAEPQAPNDRLQQWLNEVVEEIAQLRQDLIDGDTAITPKGTPRDLSTMDPMTVAMVAYYDRVLAALRELVPACLGMAIAGERLLEAFPEPAPPAFILRCGRCPEWAGPDTRGRGLCLRYRRLEDTAIMVASSTPACAEGMEKIVANA